MMRKIFLIITCLFSIALVNAQSIYKMISGEISFFSEAPMENIEAHNEQVKAIINTDKKEFAFVVPIIGFKFEKPLMEEHFNENYMESEKYKTAQFKGVYVGDIDLSKNGTYKVEAKGQLTIHGVEKERKMSGEFEVIDGKLLLKTDFIVKLEDHKIKIPKLVVKNIAEEVKVSVNLNFEPKK